MAKKSGVVPQELQTWYDRIHAAEKLRQDVAERYGWDRIRKELKGEYKSVIGAMKGTPIVPVNLVHAFVRTAVPALYFRDPRFTANPKGVQYIERAKIIEPILNYRWQCLRMKHEMRKVLGDAIGWAGHGWIKTGYTAEAETRRTERASSQGKGKDATPVYETDTVIKNERIWAYRVSPNHIAFNSDESVDPPNDCRWISHELNKPLATVKKMYPGNDDLQATYMTAYDVAKDSSASSRGKGYSSATKGDQDRAGVEMVRLYEITDMDTGQILVLADDWWKPLQDARSFPYEFKGFNYSLLKFNDVPDEPYPYSDIYAAEPQIFEITKLLSMALNHVKRFNRQVFVRNGALTPTEKAKFQQGVDGAVIEYQGEMPQPMNYPQLQPDIYNILDRLQMIFDNIVGQSAFDRGSSTAVKTRTLGEVSTIQRATGTRAAEKLDMVEDFTEDIADKMLSLIRQYTDVPEFVAVTGLDPRMLNKLLTAPTSEMMGKMADETGFYFTKKDIQGKYDLQVVAGSTKPLAPDYRNELLVQILRFGQALGFQPGDPASNEVGRELFRGIEMLGVERAFEEKIQASAVQQSIQVLMQQKQQLEQQVAQVQQKGQAIAGQVQQAQAALAAMTQQMEQQRSVLPNGVVVPGGGGAL